MCLYFVKWVNFTDTAQEKMILQTNQLNSDRVSTRFLKRLTPWDNPGGSSCFTSKLAAEFRCHFSSNRKKLIEYLLNGSVSLQYSCDMIKIPVCSLSINTEHTPTFCSLLLTVVTFLNAQHMLGMIFVWYGVFCR